MSWKCLKFNVMPLSVAFYFSVTHNEFGSLSYLWALALSVYYSVCLCCTFILQHVHCSLTVGLLFCCDAVMILRRNTSWCTNFLQLVNVIENPLMVSFLQDKLILVLNHQNKILWCGSSVPMPFFNMFILEN